MSSTITVSKLKYKSETCVSVHLNRWKILQSKFPLAKAQFYNTFARSRNRLKLIPKLLGHANKHNHALPACKH